MGGSGPLPRWYAVVPSVILLLTVRTAAGESPLAEFQYPVSRNADVQNTEITMIDVLVDTSLVPESWRLGSSRWNMRVMLPSRQSASIGAELPRKLPAAMMLHPTQVFTMSPANDQYETAVYLARHGIVTVLSLEQAGQFGGVGNGLEVGRRLSQRGVAMIRTLYKLAETDESSALYGRVKRQFW